jgi:cell division protein FtsB
MDYRQGVGTFGLSVGRLRRGVRIGDAIHSHTIVVTVGIALLIAGLCFLYLFQGTTLLDLTAQRSAAQERLTEIEETNRWLQAEIMQTFSLERVERFARERLGLIEPKVIRYVKLPPTSNEK